MGRRFGQELECTGNRVRTRGEKGGRQVNLKDGCPPPFFLAEYNLKMGGPHSSKSVEKRNIVHLKNRRDVIIISKFDFVFNVLP